MPQVSITFANTTTMKFHIDSIPNPVTVKPELGIMLKGEQGQIYIGPEICRAAIIQFENDKP